MSEHTVKLTRHSTFLLKDLCDDGLAAVRNEHPVRASSLSDIIKAVNSADDLYGADGAPNFDLHIWLALATMLIAAGDAMFSGVTATVRSTEHGVDQWDFRLDYSNIEDVWLESMEDAHKRMTGEKGVYDTTAPHGHFLTVTRLRDDEGVVLESVIEKHTPKYEGFGWKAMGEIHDKDIALKMVSYPASVHPKLKDRTIANIPLYVASKLGDAGLAIRAHWFPTDTSKSYARYILSDGIEHYLIDFWGGRLALMLSHLDKYIGRTVDMDGIVLDEIRPPMISLDELDKATTAISGMDFESDQLPMP